MTESSSKSIEQVIAEYVVQLEHGNSPEKQDVLKRYPHLRDELDEFFELHDRFSELGDTPATAGTQPAQPGAGSSISTRPPQFLGDYEILEEIDRGGMGVVYKARHQKLNRTVALKLIRSGELASPEEVQRFISEAEAAATLTHPGIVPIYEVGTMSGLVFYTMAFIEGQSLAQAVAGGKMTVDDAVRITHKLCQAVEYAHKSGVYHRDLKPANVLINDAGQPVIIDFGLAKVVNNDQDLTATGQLLGTPAYMTPEHASGRVKQAGPAADVYALGAILYFLCAGQPAFTGPTPFDVLLQVLDRRPPRPSKLNKEVSRDIDVLCLKMLEKEPQLRYQSAADFADELQCVITGQPIDHPQEGVFESLRKWWQREPNLVAHMLGIGVTTLIVILAFVVRNNYSQEHSMYFFYRLGLLLIWLSASYFLQSWVALAKWTHVAIYSWLTIDVTLYTSLIAFADEPRSLLLIGYPMMVAASALYYQRRFTVTTTLLCVAGFLILALFFPGEQFQKKFEFGAIFLCGLSVICLCLIALINRVRGLSRFYEE